MQRICASPSGNPRAYTRTQLRYPNYELTVEELRQQQAKRIMNAIVANTNHAIRRVVSVMRFRHADGHNVLVPMEQYAPKEFLEGELRKFGVHHLLLDYATQETMRLLVQP